MEVVKKAERSMIDKGENKEYLPIQGLDAFRKATVELLLGDSAAVSEVNLLHPILCAALKAALKKADASLVMPSHSRDGHTKFLRPVVEPI